MNKAPAPLSLFHYSFLALPLAFAGLPLYMHAPDFYTRELGMSIGLIGIILLVIRLIDAFQDPLIGYLSDKYAKSRVNITVIGSIFLILGFSMLFNGPVLSFPLPLWFALSMILATTGFSIVTINMNMIGGFWQTDPAQRTRISAWRESFALIGLLTASVWPAVLQNFKTTEESFEILVWAFGLIMIGAIILFSRFMSRIPSEHLIHQSQPQKGLSFLSLLKGENRGFFGVCFFTHLAAAMPGVLVLFFIRDYLGAGHLTGLFLILYFLSGAALIGVWVKIARKIGKERAWLISMVLAICTFIWAFMLTPGDVIAYGIICILSGMSLGADLALPPSILADRVSAQKKEAQATQYYAILAFIPKIAIAIASGVAFLILGYLGFSAGADNSPQSLQGLIVLYASIPCLIKIIAAYLLWWLYKKEGRNYAQTERNSSHGTNDVS
jgi:GPH family glycoside/pentoside/hexuronide:cation symporter